MGLLIHRGKRGMPIRVVLVIVLALLGVGFSFNDSYSGQSNRQKTFSSPEEAFKVMAEAIEAGNEAQLVAVFGPFGKKLFSSGGEVNGQTREQFLKEYGEKMRLEKVGTKRVVLHVGPEDWPWPIPVVMVGTRWRFDVREGRREILARRIGGNEVAAVQVCLAYVDAQREYARDHRTAKGLGEYARKFMSDAEKENGLCWEAKTGEKQSPLGPDMAKACEVSDSGAQPKGQTTPYYGYFFKILSRQGKDALGGAYDYVVDGKMIGGFALVAYPAFYGESGIMTFIVNQDGIVYEKNLGKKTGEIARAMSEFNPDKTWSKVE